MKAVKQKVGLTPAALKAAADGNLGNLATALTPGGIEAQEKQGQLVLAENEMLPIEGTSKPEERAAFERLGFVFGDVEPEQRPIFVACKFPKGWKKVPTEHSMWSQLVDDQGRERAMIFYKAAFYDRNAHMSLEGRFSVGARYTPEDKPTHIQIEVRDKCKASEAIHVVGVCGRGEWTAKDALVKAGEDWLTERFPEWKSAAAYWE